MRKPFLIFGLVFIIVIIVSAFSLKKDKNPADLGDCLKKVKSEWGSKCVCCDDFKNSYKVYFVNVCEDTLDIKIAMQNKNKTWKIFEKENVKPKDTLVGFSCDGTGKLLKFAKKSSERTNIPIK